MLDFLLFLRVWNNSRSSVMTGQVSPFVHPEFSLILEMTGHFSHEQPENSLLEMT